MKLKSPLDDLLKAAFDRMFRLIMEVPGQALEMRPILDPTGSPAGLRGAVQDVRLYLF